VLYGVAPGGGCEVLRTTSVYICLSVCVSPCSLAYFKKPHVQTSFNFRPRCWWSWLGRLLTTHGSALCNSRFWTKSRFRIAAAPRAANIDAGAVLHAASSHKLQMHSTGVATLFDSIVIHIDGKWPQRVGRSLLSTIALIDRRHATYKTTHFVRASIGNQNGVSFGAQNADC